MNRVQSLFTPIIKKLWLPVLLCFAMIIRANAQQCIIDPPSNLFVSNITSCSAILHWNATTGAVNYQVSYRLSPSGSWSPKLSIGLDTFYTFTGLGSGKNYDLAVFAKCSDGSKSQPKKKHAKIHACGLPSSVSVQFLNPGTAQITVSSTCPADTIHYRYAPLNGNWITSYVVNTSSILLTELTPGNSYTYQVSTCPLSQDNWTPVDTFTLPRPNFLLIIADDSRYDSYSITGGPSWFQTPSITRIADEGIDFTNSFAVYSYCSPSRGTIMTGLYPHKNGATDNTHTIHPYLPNLATILQGAGYHTGMIGKYIINPPQPGYDYWLDAWPDYIDAKYNYNGTSKIIPGHNTDVLTDSALKFISQSQQPFYLWLAYHAPHDPPVPTTAFDSLYADQPMPVPDNTDPYTVNYPSFLDNFGSDITMTPSEIPAAYESYYETLGGLDPAIDSVLTRLDSLHILDNTMIIYTSDNGHLYGEHGMFCKQLAYEPSIRVPLFIRYPLWFHDSTVVQNQIALNIDIAPTIIQAAGIEDTFNFDGVSLKKLADKTVKRKDMMYEMISKVTGPGSWPFIRGVRSFTNKYVYYGCSADTVEEFFDLVNDPEENTNLINNPSYSALIQSYRDRLLVLKEQYDDTIPEAYQNCYLVNPQEKLAEPSESENLTTVYPNPSDGMIFINAPELNGQVIQVITPLGVQVAAIKAEDSGSKLDLKFLPPGLYYLVYETGPEKKMIKIVIE